MASEQLLRKEIRLLGDLLGQVVREQAGEEAFQLVEDVRALAKARRKREAQAEDALIRTIASLDSGQITHLIQALSVFFDLANLAEDRHRARVINERQRRAPSPGIERVEDVALLLRQSGLSAERVQALLEQMSIDFVFTAHPTEAKRRSIREKLRDLRAHLHQLDDAGASTHDEEQLHMQMLADLIGMWQTDFVRFRRPSVIEELDRSLFFADNLWRVTPRLYRGLRDALRQCFPGIAFDLGSLVRFGTWIGGDRDGNPNVTADITKHALQRLRHEALTRHIEQARRTRRTLSMSTRKVEVSAELLHAIDAAIRKWPDAEAIVSHLSEHEPYRRWLRIVQWRLEQSLSVELLHDAPAGAYAQSREFADDLRLMRRSLSAHGGALIANAHLDDWICQANVFGFHLMRLDVRQESSWYHEVMAELLAQLGVTNYAELDEQNRQQVLTESMDEWHRIDRSRVSDQSQEALTLFELLASTCAISGPDGLGAHVISMTHQPSDVLVVLWLSRWAANNKGLPDGRLPMPIAPLFETIDDLDRAATTLDSILQHPAYAAHVRALGNTQVVMIGYSDSTKDGGYLAACWHLYDAQIALSHVAAKHNVHPVFFHGRGGSLGRGGGPAARSILSLPPGTLHAGFRMTEQGEVLAERYDDPVIAHRHLEQVVSAAIASAADALQQRRTDVAHRQLLARMSERSRQAYRELVDLPGFIEYFEQATPITQIEQLPIGSRPARRKADRSLATLRAIPWVFSWTQCRHMIPAWYGLGSALHDAIREPHGEQTLKSLYQENLFFRATIDNAALALAKADMDIAHLHAGLAENPETRETIWKLVSNEFTRTRRTLLRLTGKRQLLADVPWLKRSIEVRNPYVDPLNIIQVELFRRLRSLPESAPDAKRMAELIRLSIQGIAGGLRTTG